MGALNGFILSMFPPGEEEKAIQTLTHFWTTIEDSMIYQDWTGGLIEGLLLREGLFNTEPLETTLRNLAALYPEGFKRKLSVGMAELNSGKKF